MLDRVEQVVVDDLPVGLPRAGCVRLGIELRQDVARDRVDTAVGNDVAREGLTGRRVVDDARQLGEVAGPHGQRRDRGQCRHALRLAVTLIVTKEERLVLEDRAAQGAAELILFEVRLGPARAVVEEVVGIERVVPHELEGAAAQLVGPRLDLQVHDAAERAAELRGVGRGLHLELVERVDAREDDDRLQPGLVVVHAVEHVVVVARALAVGRERRGGAPGEAAGAVDVRSGDAAQDARDGARQVDEVAAVERQRLNLFGLAPSSPARTRWSGPADSWPRR